MLYLIVGDSRGEGKNFKLENMWKYKSIWTLIWFLGTLYQSIGDACTDLVIVCEIDVFDQFQMVEICTVLIKYIPVILNMYLYLFQQYQSSWIKVKLMQFHKLTPPVILGAKDFLIRAHATCDKREKCKKVQEKLNIDGQNCQFSLFTKLI